MRNLWGTNCNVSDERVEFEEAKDGILIAIAMLEFRENHWLQKNEK